MCIVCYLCIVLFITSYILTLFYFYLYHNPYHKTIIQKHRGGLRNEKQKHGVGVTQLQGTALNQDEGTDAPSSSSSGRSRRLAINNVNDKLTKEYTANPNDGDHTVDVGVLLHQVEEGDEEENNHYGHGHEPEYEGMNKHDDDGHSIHESERHLEVVGDVCPDELQVVCVNGFVADGRSCAEACGNTVQHIAYGYIASGGDCCSGYLSCKGFSGTICRDRSSCSGPRACMYANITSVLRGCNGENSCLRAARYGGSIGSLKDSCHGFESCRRAAFTGSIGSLEDSCNNRKACFEAADKAPGSIGSVVNSFNGDFGCFKATYYGTIGSLKDSCNANQACYKAAYEGSIGSMEDSCNADGSCYEAAYDGNDNIAEFYNCCNTDEQCKDATEATLPGKDNCVAPSEVSC